MGFKNIQSEEELLCLMLTVFDGDLNAKLKTWVKPSSQSSSDKEPERSKERHWFLFSPRKKLKRW